MINILIGIAIGIVLTLGVPFFIRKVFMNEWSTIETGFKKPIGWWYHKIMCEIHYDLDSGNTKYHYHLNKMVDKYGINLYGTRI